VSEPPYSQAKQLFLEVVALPEGERAAFLERACADDPALRAEVESLLGWHVDDRQKKEKKATPIPRARPAVAFLPPDAPTADSNRLSSALPGDLLDKVRGRVRLLAMFAAVASAVGPVLFLVSWSVGAWVGSTPPPEFFANAPFVAVDGVIALVSLGLWWLARRPAVPASRLLFVGLGYEIALCFSIAFTTYWQDAIEKGVLPNLTWAPVVIVLFPLILPGPPRRMLIAAVMAAAMSPVALIVLDSMGKVAATADNYFQAVLSTTFAAAFAYVGARVVYGLGREVAAARELGSYRLEEKLGEGGMGEVWRAGHRLLARPAAIKLIRPSLASDGRPEVTAESQRRFEREAQVIARLRSPHTVGLYDFGVAADGAFYYVMELLDGLDADTLVRRFGPLPAARAVHVLTQVCHSLSEAESCGIVHRDIKPANIFLCRYGEDVDFVKVLDFGIVRTLGGAADGSITLTQEQVIRGTPAFIAPEQALGRQDVDARADIYATGCVAYWLLTGRLVFTGATPLQTLMHHVNTPPTPPSSQTELAIPIELDRLVLACLAKDPADRPQSARELSRQLAALTGIGRWSEDAARAWWGSHLPGAR
jgi:serine/threonine-protein kinase